MESDRRLLLMVGIVHDAEDQLGVTAPGRHLAGEVVVRCQIGQPRLAWSRQTRRPCRILDRSHDAGDIGRAAIGTCLGLRCRRSFPHLPGAELQLLDDHLRPAGSQAAVATDVAGLEGHQPSGSGLGHGASGSVLIEEGGLRRGEDVLGVVDISHAQSQPQVGVRPQWPLDHARRLLRGQNHVQSQRATALSHVHHPVDELRHLLNQGGELVDHDHQARRGQRREFLLHGRQVLAPMLIGDEELSIVQFRGQGGERTTDAILVQVSDQTNSVGQVVAVGEGRAAFVVHQQEVEALWAVGARHRQNPGLQQLRLTRTGRTADEGMGTVSTKIQAVRPRRTLADDRA